MSINAHGFVCRFVREIHYVPIDVYSIASHRYDGHVSDMFPTSVGNVSCMYRHALGMYRACNGQVTDMFPTYPWQMFCECSYVPLLMLHMFVFAFKWSVVSMFHICQ